MDLPVVIVPLPNHGGFSARLAAPIEFSAEAPTADEAQARLSTLLQEKLHQGVEFRVLRVWPANGPARGGWLPDDELTQEWLQHMKEYRNECDAADRALLDGAAEPEEKSP
jgi:hypothetical protein